MKFIITIVLFFAFNKYYAQKENLPDSVKAKYQYIFETNSPTKQYQIRAKNGKEGLISQTGILQIKPTYNYIYYRNENMIEVGKLVKGKMLRGLVDTFDNVIIPLKYEDIYPLTLKSIRVGNANKYGVVDTKNNIVLPIKYNEIIDGNENTIIALENKLYTYYAENGKKITSTQFKKVERFYNRAALVTLKDNSSAALQPDGTFLFAPKNNIRFLTYKNGILVAMDIKSKNQGIFNATGTMTVPFKYDEIEVLPKYLRVKKDDKYGITNTNDSVVFPLVYDFITTEMDNHLLLQQEKNYGIMDYSKKIIIPIQYKYIQQLSDQYYVVTTHKKTNGIIDSTGKIVLNENAVVYNIFENRVFAKINEKNVIIDLQNSQNTKEAIVDSFKYEEKHWFQNHHKNAIGYVNKKCGVIDMDNNIIIPFEYNDISEIYSTKKYIVFKNGKYGVVDGANKIIHEIIYDRISPMKETISLLLNGKRIVKGY